MSPHAARLAALLGADVARPPAAGACVRVDGIDATTVPLLGLLVEAGVRRFEVVDRRPVDERLAALLPAGELGAPRRAAAARWLAERGAGAQVAPLAVPDLVVLSREHIHDPASTGHLMSEDVPHVLLSATELGMRVGPVVVPGATACAQCIALACADADPGYAREALRALRREPTVLPLRLHHFAAGAAAVLAVDFLRAGGTTHPGEMWSLSDAGVRRVRWRPHPRCGCGATGAFSAGNPGRRAEPAARSRRTGRA